MISYTMMYDITTLYGLKSVSALVDIYVEELTKISMSINDIIIYMYSTLYHLWTMYFYTNVYLYGEML